MPNASQRLYRLSVTYPESAYSDRLFCAGCAEPVKVDDQGVYRHIYDGTPLDGEDAHAELDRDWEPDGWLSDADARQSWIERFGESKFFWPKADKVYFTRGTAQKRARLLESYGALVTIVESEPVIWLTVDRIRAKRIAELTNELERLQKAATAAEERYR